jgi:hypothetical protein
MVERLVRNEEVRGSIPLGSTKDLSALFSPFCTARGIAAGASAVVTDRSGQGRRGA